MPSLSATLAPPSTTTYGRWMPPASRPSALGLGGDQVSGRVRQAHGDLVDAGVLAVHHAEAVGDVRRRPVPPAGPANAPRSASSLLVSPALKRRFSSMTTPPGRRAATAAWAARPDGVGGELDRAAEQLGQPRRDRRERVAGVWRAARTAKMSADHDPGARAISALRVGKVARIRASSVMRVPSSGTFRSARTRTRRPATSRSSIVFMVSGLLPADSLLPLQPSGLAPGRAKRPASRGPPGRRAGGARGAGAGRRRGTAGSAGGSSGRPRRGPPPRCGRADLDQRGHAGRRKHHLSPRNWCKPLIPAGTGMIGQEARGRFRPRGRRQRASKRRSAGSSKS